MDGALGSGGGCRPRLGRDAGCLGYPDARAGWCAHARRWADARRWDRCVRASALLAYRRPGRRLIRCRARAGVEPRAGVAAIRVPLRVDAEPPPGADVGARHFGSARSASGGGPGLPAGADSVRAQRTGIAQQRRLRARRHHSDIPRGLGACLCLWCCRHWGRRSQGRGQSSLGVGRLWRLPCAPLQLCGCAACRLVSGLRSRVRRAGRSDLGARRATGGPAGPAHGERRRCLGSGLDRNRPLGDAQRRPRRRPFAARGLLPVRPFGGPACPPNFSCRWSVADGCRSAQRAFGSGTLGRGAPVSRRLASC